ncbi:tetratricopeptide repeat protein [Streptomyces sp. NPDC023723]|uniref:tetratricopeptide repeat protein n=1 Tax=Streptomyces sp. NPDC023723 TaxID=3154323 RepID=UPI0033D9E8D4
MRPQRQGLLLQLIVCRPDAAGELCRSWTNSYPTARRISQLLSRTRAALGRPDEAIGLMTDVVARRERGLGPEHPFTVAGRRLLDTYRPDRR